MSVSKLKSLLPYKIVAIFNRMELAEQVITHNLNLVDSTPNLSSDEQERQIDIIHNSFKHLCTSYELPSRLYRRHCQQIIDCLLANTTPPPTTDAEILLILSTTSNVFPINREYRCAFSKLFVKQFPNEHKLIDETSEPETYDNYERSRADEIINEMRAGLSEARTVTSKQRKAKRSTLPTLPTTKPSIPLSLEGITDFLKV